MINQIFLKWKKVIIQSSLVIILIIFLSQATFALDYVASGKVGWGTTNEDTIGTWNWIVIVDYTLIPEEPEWPWDIRFEFGYNNFKYKDSEENFYWMNISASIRYSFQMQNFKPFIGLGPGFYIPEEGDNRFGVKLGLGVDFPIIDRFTLELGADFHNIFLRNGNKFIEDKNFSFLTINAGILFRINR